MLGFSLKAEGSSYPNHLKRDVLPVPKNIGGIQQMMGEEVDIKLGNFSHEKMLNITHYQRNANHNLNEVPLHASQNGCYPTVYKQ